MIREWFRRRKERRQQELKVRGFEYAMSAYFLYGVPCEYLNHGLKSGAFDWNEFDQGVSDACALIEKLDPTETYCGHKAFGNE